MRAAEGELKKLKNKSKGDEKRIRDLTAERGALMARLKDRSDELVEKNKMVNVRIYHSLWYLLFDPLGRERKRGVASRIIFWLSHGWTWLNEPTDLFYDLHRDSRTTL